VAVQFLAILVGQACVKGKAVLDNTALMRTERRGLQLFPLLLRPHGADHVAPENWHCRARPTELTRHPKGASCCSMETRFGTAFG
jgi:hypothetical protein